MTMSDQVGCYVGTVTNGDNWRTGDFNPWRPTTPYYPSYPLYPYYPTVTVTTTPPLACDDDVHVFPCRHCKKCQCGKATVQR